MKEKEREEEEKRGGGGGGGELECNDTCTVQINSQIVISFRNPNA